MRIFVLNVGTGRAACDGCPLLDVGPRGQSKPLAATAFTSTIANTAAAARPRARGHGLDSWRRILDGQRWKCDGNPVLAGTSPTRSDPSRVCRWLLDGRDRSDQRAIREICQSHRLHYDRRARTDQRRLSHRAAGELVAGSMVFTPTPGPVPLNNFYQWWRYHRRELAAPGRTAERPQGPRKVSGRPGRLRRAVAYTKWAESGCRRKPSGSSRPAAGERQALCLGR